MTELFAFRTSPSLLSADSLNSSTFSPSSWEQSSLTSSLLSTDPDNTQATAYALGSASSTPIVVSDSVGAADTDDYYKVKVSSYSKLNIALTGLTADADVYLLNSSGLSLNGSFRGGTTDDAINQTVSAGDYYVRVRRSTGDTNYKLLVSTTQAGNFWNAGLPSNLLPSEFVATSTNYTRSGSISYRNTADVIRFSGNAGSTVNISLQGLSADLDVRILRDSNGNGSVDVTEQLAISQKSGSAAEAIALTLPETGNYYAQVYSAYGSSSNYTLNIVA